MLPGGRVDLHRGEDSGLGMTLATVAATPRLLRRMPSADSRAAAIKLS